MKWIKALLLVSAALLFAIGFRYYKLCRQQLPLPEQWKQVHRGQPREEVLTRLPALMTDLYDVKSFDQTHHFSKSPVFGRVAQYLIVRYGPDDRVSDIQMRTLLKIFGCSGTNVPFRLR
ncbi:MAG: hypothetical protein EOP84_18985 [Verrucomicrobiaceae bacterium]|nr:MAG: hypothetical protein EOP84_18985 [Verrucomicrobiaceae bacterium]